MSYDPSFGEWVREHLAGMGELTIKRMFGGASVYSNGLIFALIDDDVLWLRADEQNEQALKDADARQFTYPMKGGKLMSMGYWSLPDSAADDPDEAVVWARASLAAAERKAAAKKPRKTKA
ncbi:MAG: TfoX/Sxy family protein [Caulobacteraceae bacterium]